MTTVLCTGFTVRNLEEALPFYSEALGCRVLEDAMFGGPTWDALYGLQNVELRRVRLALGNDHLELTQYLNHPDGRAIPEDSRSNDRWFQHIAIVVSDMEAAHDYLQQFNITPVSQRPQTLPDWNPNAGGIKAFYFKAPDTHILELIWFPEGKGNLKWQDGTDLFLGIDHTAIAVADTETSFGFYHDLLGLRVAGESENYGVEQARLNNVEGAHLHITGMAADEGFGVEFLEYLEPRDGRPYPTPSHVYDLWHWETVIAVSNIAQFYQRAVDNGFHMLSEVVDGMCLLRDPDGHVIRLVEG